MGFLSLLRSLDELLYEIISWLVFFPLTLWRALRRPLRMMDYADTELADKPVRQYTATLSPPLFLFLALLLAHLVELAVVGENVIVGSTRGISRLIDSDTNLLIMRALLFSVFPLVMATWLVVRQGIGLDRDTLRPPFYSQCFVAAPFALVISLAGTIMRPGSPWAELAGLCLIVLALIWYGTLQVRWFAMHLKQSRVRSFVDASLGMILSLAIMVGIGALFR